MNKKKKGITRLTLCIHLSKEDGDASVLIESDSEFFVNQVIK